MCEPASVQKWIFIRWLLSCLFIISCSNLKNIIFIASWKICFLSKASDITLHVKPKYVKWVKIETFSRATGDLVT